MNMSANIARRSRSREAARCGHCRRALCRQLFSELLFSKIVPVVKKMGRISERQRKRFEDLGILQFESWADPFEDLEREQASADALVA